MRIEVALGRSDRHDERHKGVDVRYDASRLLRDHRMGILGSIVARALFAFVVQSEPIRPRLLVLDALILGIAHIKHGHGAHTRERELQQGAKACPEGELVRRVKVLGVVKRIDGHAEELGAAVPVAPPLLHWTVEAEHKAHGEVEGAEEVDGVGRRLDFLSRGCGIDFCLLIDFFEILNLWIAEDIVLLGESLCSCDGTDGGKHTGRE